MKRGATAPGRLPGFSHHHEDEMGTDQFTGILRAIVPAVTAYIAGKGWIPADTAADVGAGVVAILAAIWSWRTNVPGKTVK